MSETSPPVNNSTVLLPSTLLLKLENFIKSLDEFKTETDLIRSNTSSNHGLDGLAEMREHVEQCSSQLEEIVAVRKLVQQVCNENSDWELDERAKLIGLRIALIRHSVELQVTVREFNNILSAYAT